MVRLGGGRKIEEDGGVGRLRDGVVGQSKKGLRTIALVAPALAAEKATTATSDKNFLSLKKIVASNLSIYFF